MTALASTPAPALDQPYDPAQGEARWYAFWEERHVFAASDAARDPRPACFLPRLPRNVTGSLHMGHAERCTLEDALVRWRRMRGYNALWQPGIDHAGIGTQLVVSRKEEREGSKRFALGRGSFVERLY